MASENNKPAVVNADSEIQNVGDIQSKIYTIRNQQVMLDSDLALMYQVETNRDGESQSIGHQRERIEEFCRQRNWAVEEVYIDDGYSGTTSNRPDLQRMLKDVENGKINVVVSKDYSRLGRDNLFTENLREIWFSKHQCRYVAINDNIDTMYDDEYAPFNGNARKWIDTIKDYADITELDSETLNRLVKQIVVHEDITADGDRNITMEIHYNFRPENESKIYNLSDVAEANSVAKAM